MTRAAVIGAGSWGTAFAQVLVDAGTETILWARREELASDINRNHANSRCERSLSHAMIWLRTFSARPCFTR